MTLRLQNLMLAMLLALSTLLLGMNNPIPNVPKIGVLAADWVDKAQNGQSAALSSEGILQRHWAMTQFQKYAQAIDVTSVYGSSEQVLYAVEMAGHDTDLLDLDVFSDVSNAHLDVFFGGDREAIHQILAGPTALGAYAVGSAMWGPSGTRPAALPSKTPTISEVRLPNKGGEATNRGADGFYDPRAWRQNYEDFYSGNVTSTTVPPYSAKNVHLAGSRHPETGVVFDQRGYPIFDDVASYDTRFSASQFSGVDYQGQMRMATRDLRNTLGSNPQLRPQFEPDQLQAIQSGKASIPRLTWHHHQDTGRMQLVPRDIHRDTGHIGGNAVSGGQ